MGKHLYRLTLVALVAGGLLLVGFSLAGRGLETVVWGVRLSARTPGRPFAVALCALGLLAWFTPPVRLALERAARLVDRHASWLAWGLALLASCAALGIGLRFGSFVASAADSYGYITQAEAFSAPFAPVPEALAAEASWPDARQTLTPLGYVTSAEGQVAPIYPPGLPLLMAGFAWLAGHSALFLVVPLLAFVAVLAIFLLGRQVGGDGVGAGAALLLLASPTFLLSASVPMSDVPATAVWTVALLAALRVTGPSAVGAGLFAGLAVLIRPNLAPIALVIVLVFCVDPVGRTRRPVWQLCGLFALGAMPGLAALLTLNAARYGSALASGYPSVDALFAMEYLWPNVRRYTRWLVDTQTPFVFLGLLAALPLVRQIVVRRVPARGPMVTVLLAWTLVVAGCYAFYLPFDTWDFLRFLLPAYPALLVSAVLVWLALARRFREPYGRLLVVGTIALVALSTWEISRVNGVFTNERSVRRFVDVPRYASTSLPAQAIYLTRVYSGSMRYYGDRPTLRWDVLDPAWLDRVVAELSARGLRPFILLEGAEEVALFRERFAAENELGALDWPPAAEYRGIESVWIYDPADRADALAGRAVATTRIPVSDRPVARR